MREKKNTGDVGEKIATSLLITKGYEIVAKNFRGRTGEIDIVAVDTDTLVFVEVKTRHSNAFGAPEEAVTKKKLKAIENVGHFFRLKYKGLPEAERIDVVAIVLDENDFPIRKELIKNVTS